MRLIDPTPDLSVERKHTCTACGAQIAYLKADVVKKSGGYDYLGSINPPTFHIVCPGCRDKQTVKPWDSDQQFNGPYT